MSKGLVTRLISIEQGVKRIILVFCVCGIPIARAYIHWFTPDVSSDWDFRRCVLGDGVWGCGLVFGNGETGWVC
jgi:hypothetical protein